MVAKRIYDKNSLQTDISIKFGVEISDVIRPIFEKYTKDGYCLRDLSHEAKAVIRDIELDHVVEIHYRSMKNRRL